jgi:hypothetical protein
VIAARRDWPLNLVYRITLEQLHDSLCRGRFGQPFLATPSFP